MNETDTNMVCRKTWMHLACPGYDLERDYTGFNPWADPVDTSRDERRARNIRICKTILLAYLLARRPA